MDQGPVFTYMWNWKDRDSEIEVDEEPQMRSLGQLLLRRIGKGAPSDGFGTSQGL